MANRTKKRAAQVSAAITRAGRDSDQFIVRMPDGMRAAVAEAAARSGRSMNAEIVFALALHLSQEGMSIDERLMASLRAKLTRPLEELMSEIMDKELKARSQASAVPPNIGPPSSVKRPHED